MTEVVKPDYFGGKEPKKRAKRTGKVGGLIVRMLCETDKDFDEIALAARTEFGGATSKKCVSWYASKIRGGHIDGELHESR